MLGSWGWSNWMLFILAAVVVAAYLGVLAPVQERLEHLALVQAVNQPAVQEWFKDDGGRADAFMVVLLFMFLSPLALFMAVTLVIFLLSALSTALGPVMGGEKVAMLVLEVVGAGAVYVERDVWLPHALYFLGLLARAYIVITTSA
jgi:hypothetical protein